MNNFNDYYNYMIGTGQNEFITPATYEKKLNDIPNYNNFMNFDNSTFQNTFMNMENTPKLYNPKEGFTKGNMFANLYSSYMNYKPYEIRSNSERQNLMNQIQMYSFALNDLNLYLDVNPKNSSLIRTYNDYLLKTKELINNYEKMYGPLTNDYIFTNDWSWVNSPWPWEVEK